MNTELFIRRPVMTTLIMAGILIFGLVAYRLLPVSDLPAVDYPSISVSANLPGASPETMASSVATPLEKELSTIPGIETMTSTSTQGGTSISLQFALSREHRRGRAGRAGGHLPGAAPASARRAAAELPEGRSVVLADSLLRAAQHHPPPAAAQRVRRDLPGPAAGHGGRRGPGAGVRVDEVRGPDPARPAAARGPEHRDRRGGGRGGERQRQPADRHPLGHRQGLLGREPGPAHQRHRLQAPGRRLP